MKENIGGNLEAAGDAVARAGSTTRYSFGENPRDLCSHGNGADQTFWTEIPVDLT